MDEVLARTAVKGEAAHGVSVAEAFWVWLRVSLLSFGGPAGQIAVMHRILVDEKKWISRRPFPARTQLLHAPARPGGAAARHLYRLADAPRPGAASLPAGCSSSPASSPSWR